MKLYSNPVLCRQLEDSTGFFFKKKPAEKISKLCFGIQ
jgi:hypothetical protein